MKRLLLILNSPIGTVMEKEDFEYIRSSFGQKKTSQLLAEHGWKKDYNYRACWRRVCTWPYFTQYYGSYREPQSIINRVKEHIGDRTTVPVKEVNILAGCHLSKEENKTVMSKLGFIFDDGFWIKEDK